MAVAVVVAMAVALACYSRLVVLKSLWQAQLRWGFRFREEEGGKCLAAEQLSPGGWTTVDVRGLEDSWTVDALKAWGIACPSTISGPNPGCLSRPRWMTVDYYYDSTLCVWIWFLYGTRTQKRG